MTQFFIECNNLSKQYGNFFSRKHVKKALQNINFSVKTGERVGIIGENGSGKTTLLKLIAGTALPSSGNLEVNGKVHAVLTLGMGMQEELTGRENLFLEGEVQGKSRNETNLHIDEMIEFADLGEFIDMPVRTYSSGMKSRLTFTSLILIDPEILILDETLSTGDQWFNKKASQRMREVCDKGKIVLIASHSMPAINSMCNRCIWIKDGKIQADGSPENITAIYEENQRRRIENQMEASLSVEDSSWSEGSDIEIKAIHMRTKNSKSGRLWTTNQESWIDIEIEINRNPVNPTMRCQIERVDGLSILDSCMPESVSSKLAQGTNCVTINFNRLIIGAGLFTLSISIEENGRVVARRQSLLKIVVEEEYLGGRPILHYPISIESEIISEKVL